MWICGGANTLAWDYALGVPQGDAANVRVGWREKPMATFSLRMKAKLFARPKDSDCEKAQGEKETKDKVLISTGKQPESDLGEIETDPRDTTCTQDFEVIRQFLSFCGSQCSSRVMDRYFSNEYAAPSPERAPRYSCVEFVGNKTNRNLSW